MERRARLHRGFIYARIRGEEKNRGWHVALKSRRYRYLLSDIIQSSTRQRAIHDILYKFRVFIERWKHSAHAKSFSAMNRFNIYDFSGLNSREIRNIH